MAQTSRPPQHLGYVNSSYDSSDENELSGTKKVHSQFAVSGLGVDSLILLAYSLLVFGTTSFVPSLLPL